MHRYKIIHPKRIRIKSNNSILFLIKFQHFFFSKNKITKMIIFLVVNSFELREKERILL